MAILLNYDIALLYALNGLVGHSLWFDACIIFAARDLTLVLIPILIGFWYIRSHEQWVHRFMVLKVIGGTFIVLATDYLISTVAFRPRPFVFDGHIPVLDAPLGAKSFPSDHAGVLFMIATTFYLWDRRWGIGMYVFAIVVSLSRVIAGIHFPLDVFAGAIIGIVVSLLIHLVDTHMFWLFRRQKTLFWKK